MKKTEDKADDVATTELSDASAAAVATDKAHYATRNFKDAGTKRSFTKGEKLSDLSDGELGNYAAASLASTTKPEAEEAA